MRRKRFRRRGFTGRRSYGKSRRSRRSKRISNYRVSRGGIRM